MFFLVINTTLKAFPGATFQVQLPLSTPSGQDASLVPGWTPPLRPISTRCAAAEHRESTLRKPWRAPTHKQEEHLTWVRELGESHHGPGENSQSPAFTPVRHCAGTSGHLDVDKESPGFRELEQSKPK